MKLGVNPLVVRELRGGIRSGRRITLLTFVLTVAGMIFLGAYALAASTLTNGESQGSAALGGVFFPMVVGVELFFVCVVTPAQTAGAIVGERERQTFDTLLATPLTPGRVVTGKLIAGLAYVMLLLVAALPIEGLAFLMGGVGPDELALALVLLTATVVFFGSLGLWASAVARNSRAATAFAYTLCGFLSLGAPVGALFASPFVTAVAFRSPALAESPPPWLIYAAEFFAATNPWFTAGLTEAQFQAGLPLFWLHEVFGKTNVDLPGPWLVLSALYTVGALLCLRGASRALAARLPA